MSGKLLVIDELQHVDPDDNRPLIFVDPARAENRQALLEYVNPHNVAQTHLVLLGLNSLEGNELHTGLMRGGQYRSVVQFQGQQGLVLAETNFDRFRRWGIISGNTAPAVIAACVAAGFSNEWLIPAARWFHTGAYHVTELPSLARYLVPKRPPPDLDDIARFLQIGLGVTARMVSS